MKEYYLHVSYAYKKSSGETCLGDGFLVHRGESIDAVSQELQKVLEEEHGCTIEKPGFLSIDVLPEQLYRSLIKKNDNAQEKD